MSALAAFLSTALISALASLCDASAFLRPHTPVEPAALTAERVVEGLLSALSESDDVALLEQFEVELRPMYDALPKGMHGELEPPTVRYALHRYFAQTRGWHMKGLSGIAVNASATGLDEVFARNLEGPGADLSKLALFASKLTQLVHQEARDNLRNIYTALELSTASRIRKKDAETAFKRYLAMYLLGEDTEGVSREDLIAAEKDLADMYLAWRSVKMWSKDLHQTLHVLQQPRRNPFVGDEVGFEQNSMMAQELGHRFGSFQNMECQSLKGTLMDYELAGTGRVALSDFYRIGLQEDWQFNENEEYLRSLGALDETDPRRPSVLIPNYLHSQTNCLSTSGYYSVCCSNECEGLLAHLERVIAGPSADPATIAKIVSGLASDTVQGPRTLSTVQLSRLKAIADLHGGQVPLHGRLFAQWMHHAYPRECPFPHLAGSTSALSQEDWHRNTGGEAPLATKEEMRRKAAELEAMTPQEIHALPWMEEEELVAPSRIPGATPAASLRSAAVLCALVFSVVPLLRAAKVASPGESGGKTDRYLV